MLKKTYAKDITRLLENVMLFGSAEYRVFEDGTVELIDPEHYD
jgi:hypothetical protein